MLLWLLLLVVLPVADSAIDSRLIGTDTDNLAAKRRKLLQLCHNLFLLLIVICIIHVCR